MIANRDYAWSLKSNNSVPYAFQEQYFSAAECEAIQTLGSQYHTVPAYLGADAGVDTKVRQNLVAFLRRDDTATHWIFQRLSQAVRDFNQQFWQYQLDFIETLQYTLYQQPGDFYTNHMDMSFNNSQEVRKLSFSVQLSDPSSYQGSNLEFLRLGHEYYLPVRTQGTVVMFPSFMVHQVTPLVSGTRASLVGWVIGPPFQ